MSTFKPFYGYHPESKNAAEVICLPYDVINSEEARELAKGKPNSYLYVDKSEIELEPGVDLHDQRVYDAAAKNMTRLIKDKILIKDAKQCFYIYKQIMDGRVQYGLVGCASAEEYWNDIIKKHELTRKDKEDDRTKHVDVCNANTGMVFLTYRAKDEINKLVEKTVSSSAPVFDVTTEDKVTHTLYRIDDDATIAKISEEFKKIGVLYIADGHHRSASGARIAQIRKEKNPKHTGNEEYNFFMAAAFPHDQLYIMDYNRLVKDLNGHSEDEFLKLLKEKFDVKDMGDKTCKPSKMHTFGMYMGGRWYELGAKSSIFDPKDVIDCLDVTILQKNVLDPLLGIKDPRTDKRIDFVGGIRGMSELKKSVDSGKFKVAFAMFPTTIEQLMDIADAGKIMPPKSTWFEPKLRSGVLVHKLDQ
ncbi:MAG TPA: DUF1015 family protein [Candidatus Wallbacteria bacterium]|nr:DUF1015 family protein [Candidatus Wallbacteria bacterium]